MTYLTKQILKKSILRSRILSLALFSLVLIALQPAPASAQCSPASECWTATGNDIHNTNTGNVRIGAVGPATPKLLVNGDSNNAWGGVVQIYRSDLGGQYSHLLWGVSGDWYIRSSLSTGKIVIQDTGGNVGIGTTDAVEKLTVSGNISVTGNINATGTITGGNIIAKYQDVAEWVPASEQIPAGTVVVLDATKSNHVIASTKGYDTCVAGVISEQPGIALGETGAGKVLVATTGRVSRRFTGDERRARPRHEISTYQYRRCTNSSSGHARRQSA
jgi:hypothetical protein